MTRARPCRILVCLDKQLGQYCLAVVDPPGPVVVLRHDVSEGHPETK